MPIYFWIDIGNLFLSLIFSTALLLIVLGYAPRKPENITFSLIAIFIFLWAFSAIALRLTLWLQSYNIQSFLFTNPKFWFRNTGIFLGYMSISSLLFTSVYIKLYSKWIKYLTVAGFFLMTILMITSFHYDFYSSCKLDEHGLIASSITPLGIFAVSLVPTFIILASILFWVHQVKGNRFFQIGLSIIYLGVLLGGILRVSLPIMSFLNIVGLTVMGYTIITQQIFNPVKTLNDQLKNTVEEKELLLRELHHRVKNNMQIIQSLLSIQSSKIENKEAVQVLKDCNTRIRSMAKIHEQLLFSKEMHHIDIAGYIETLILDFKYIYGKKIIPIEYEIEIEPFDMTLEYAIPTGIIINELLTNAIKHGFSKSKNSPEIQIKIKKKSNDNVIIKVQDNGTGLPSGMNPEHSKSFGLYIINKIATQQLGGACKFASSDLGTVCKISFPVK